VWHRALSVGLLAALVGGPGAARAHGPAPSVLAVLAVDDGGRPALLRTSVGLANARGDGSYDYVCPSQWEGLETAFAASLPDRSLVATIAWGALYASRDGLCAFEPVALPEPYRAVGVEPWGERLWVLAREGGGDATRGALFALDDALELERAHRFEAGFVPLDLRAGPGPGGPDERLWVVAAEPEPALWVAERAAPGRWRRLAGLPSRSPVWLSLRGAGRTELWMQATVEEGRRLWRVELAPDLRSVTVQRGDVHETVHGPERLADEWVAVLDGQLARWSRAAGRWEHGAARSWTCLSRRADRLYACGLDALFELSVADGGVRADPAFRFVQLGPPRPGCPPEPAAAQACASDWAHFGGEAGWLATVPATSPDGVRSPIEPGADAGGTGGCGVGAAPKGSGAAPATALAAALLLLGRRRTLRGGST
jgi:hypothetical protein